MEDIFSKILTVGKLRQILDQYNDNLTIMLVMRDGEMHICENGLRVIKEDGGVDLMLDITAQEEAIDRIFDQMSAVELDDKRPDGSPSGQLVSLDEYRNQKRGQNER